MLENAPRYYDTIIMVIMLITDFNTEHAHLLTMTLKELASLDQLKLAHKSSC